MPLPRPQAGESQEKFLSRCMADETMNREYPEKDQRFAICQSRWEKKESSVEIGEGLYVFQQEIGPEPPREILIHPYGHIEHYKGAYDFTDEAMNQAVANFGRYGNDIVIDYGHESYYRTGRGEAAGWVKELMNRGRDGLWAVVEWTMDAIEAILAKKFRSLALISTAPKASAR